MKTYQDYIPPDEGRSYALAKRTDGTYAITDVTKYRQTGDAWSAADANATAQAGVQIYTHSYHTQTHVHNFTGSGANGRVLIAAAYTRGDTFAVNGAACPAYTGEDAAEELAIGRWMTFTYDGAQLNFKSGGSALNFKVIAVAGAAALPANAKENTIAVITDTPISEWQIRVNQPAARRDQTALSGGEIWVCNGITSLCKFDAFKKNSLEVLPRYVKQYVNGAWVFKVAKIYKNARWIPIQETLELLNSPYDQCNDVTGGWGGAISYSRWNVGYTPRLLGNDASSFYVQSREGFIAHYRSTLYPVDLTDIKTLYIRWHPGGESNNTYDATCIFTVTRTHSISLGDGPYLEYNANDVNGWLNSQMDVTGLTGLWYLTFVGHKHCETARGFGINMWVQKVWGV